MHVVCVRWSRCPSVCLVRDEPRSGLESQTMVVWQQLLPSLGAGAACVERTSFATGVVRHPHSCVYVTEPPEALYLCVCMCTSAYSSVHLYIRIHTDRDIHIACISDIDVGYPGRAGDNTVLTHNWLMKAIAANPDEWLGGRLERGAGHGDGGRR